MGKSWRTVRHDLMVNNHLFYTESVEETVYKFSIVELLFTSEKGSTIAVGMNTIRIGLSKFGRRYVDVTEKQVIVTMKRYTRNEDAVAFLQAFILLFDACLKHGEPTRFKIEL